MHASFRSYLKYLSTPFLIFTEGGFFVVVVWMLFHDVRLFLIVSGLINMALLVTPRALHHSTRLRVLIQRDVIHLIEIVVCTMAILNGLGALSFYRSMQYYDTAAHFIGALGAGVIVALVLGAGFKTAHHYTLQRLRFFSILITLVFLFLWEAFEYGGDLLFNTTMLGQDGEAYDTVYDIVAGSIAMILLYAVDRSVIHRYFYGKYKKIKRHQRPRNSQAIS